MKNPTIEEFKHHAINREYMSGIEREKARTKATGEVFTPNHLVIDILNGTPQHLYADKEADMLDPTCGDGQILSQIVYKKMENGLSHLEAITTTWGADLMLDNCIETIKRLYMVDENQIETITGAKLNEVDKQWRTKGLIALFKIRNTDGSLLRIKRPDGKLTAYINIVQADGIQYDYKFGGYLTA